MKIKHVHIENFKSIKHIDFNFPENNLLILTGHNNAGKSNIVRAIDLICGENWKKASDLNNSDYYLRDLQNNIKIELTFDNEKIAVFDTGFKDKKGNQDKWCVRYYNNQQDRWENKKIYDINIKDDFPCIYLGADRDFEKQTSFFNYSLLGKIKKEFNKKAKNYEDELKNNFEKLNEIYEKVEGFKDFKEKFSNYFQSMQADAPVKLELDFKCFTPNNYFSNMNILAKDPDQDNDFNIDLNELGEGSKNIALISLLRSYADSFKGNSGILILEEPELFLHPQARRHLFSQLKELAKSGFQVILSTHSNSFIETELFESIGQVFKVADDKNENKTNTKLLLNTKQKFVNFCTKTGAPKEKITIDNITRFYSILSDKKITEGFFARIIILVEGETEEYVLPFLLKKAGIDCDLLNISILMTRGKAELPKYWRMYAQYNAPIISIFDYDECNDSKNKILFDTFNINSDNIKFNNYFYYDISEKNINNNLIKFKTIIFEKDFETTYEKDFETTYEKDFIQQQTQNSQEILDKINKTIIEYNITQKHQKALWKAKTISAQFKNYNPKFITELVQIINNIISLKETNYYENITINNADDDIPF